MAENTFDQSTRPLRLDIQGIDKDNLVLVSFTGTEKISRLYSFTLEFLVHDDAGFKFEQALGKAAAVSLDHDPVGTRYFHGMINRLNQIGRDDRYVRYRAELVPPLWLLTKIHRSRIFQDLNIPDILKQCYGSLYSPKFRLQATYNSRNYCVQYREADFDFISRLMEEEGIWYCFTHSDSEQALIIADNPQAHPDLPLQTELVFASINESEGRITSWEKTQELRSGSVSLTDFNFEMPTKRLDVISKGAASVTSGTVEHKLNVAPSSTLSLVDHPAGYAFWSDGISRGGADQASNLENIFKDNVRIGKTRMEQEFSEAVHIEAESNYRWLTPGCKFTLSGHFDADGPYVLTSVSHEARSDFDASSGSSAPFEYSNKFECIPFALPYRPIRTTERPIVRGTQTAFVVGSPGAEIDPDKYGRVKVCFHWDPADPDGLNTTCWVRSTQVWAGNKRGTQFIPRVGDEVVVSFLEGDPDRPLIVGSVYNSENKLIYDLPQNKTQSGIKSRSSLHGSEENFNELRFEDKKGEEQIYIHAEKDMVTIVENSSTVNIGGNPDKGGPHKAGKSTIDISGDTSVTISKGDLAIHVVAGKEDMDVKGPVTWTFLDTLSVTVSNAIDVQSKSDHVHVSSPTEILLKVGGSFIKITPDTITLHAAHIVVEGTADAKVTAPDVDIFGKSTLKGHSPDATFQGTATAKLLGGTVTITGDSSAVMNVGGDSVTCKAGVAIHGGPKVDVIGDGPVNIKGAVVQVNC